MDSSQTHPVLGVGFAPVVFENLKSFFVMRNPSEAKGGTMIPYGRD